ncbi:MAG: four helix bundle protein [Kiritimatiellae bacterium]|nr:four helix bundle protein [Kiritimatiellia bacterium]
MKDDDPLKTKSMDFAVRIVKFSSWLRTKKKAFSIADQILRSGTSIGANLAEARFASSKKDFLNKCKIALKECSETLFWIELIVKSDLINQEQAESVFKDCQELQRMLSATCATFEKGLSLP